MTKFHLLAVLLIAAMLDSCKKEIDETTSATAANISVYTRLKTGNYWVYQVYLVDSDGVETLQPGETDSCYIAGERIIGGKTYFVYYSQFFGESYLRDSADCLTDRYGNILFSTAFPGVKLRKYTVYDGTGAPIEDAGFFTVGTPHRVNAPAGNFTCAGFRNTLSFYPPYNSHVQNMNMFTYYAVHVGKVQYEFAYFTPLTINRQFYRLKLLRYHVQ